MLGSEHQTARPGKFGRQQRKCDEDRRGAPLRRADGLLAGAIPLYVRPLHGIRAVGPVLQRLVLKSGRRVLGSRKTTNGLASDLF
jgi:hypothetical protein